MLILANEILLNNVIENSNPWYSDPLIAFILSIIGIILSGLGSWFSFEAYQAAIKAGHIVKIQDILIEVTELTEKCNLKLNLTYEQASELLHILSSKNNRFVTIFSDLITKADANLIIELENAFENARGKLNSLNPVINPGLQNQTIEGFIYYTMESDFSKIGQTLNKLKAVLEKNSAPGGSK